MHMMALPRNRRQGGYALLEALIAVIVAAVGFIGAARMQTFGMKLSSSAQLRQKATLLAYQMTDRVRANESAASTGGSYDSFTTVGTSCLAAGCATGALVAASDYKDWIADVQQLPSGKGVVCRDSTPDDGSSADPKCDGVGRLIAVKVWWKDRVSTTRDLPEETRFVTLVRTWRGD